MVVVECRDIFNGVYSNVKNSYIEKWYSSTVKNKTSNKDISELENLVMSKTDTPVGEKNINNGSICETFDEMVSESVERKSESEVASKIRADVDEKFPFIIASACSNLSTLDKRYRKMKGYEEQESFCEFVLEMTEKFPLSDRFVYPCVMYVSSMLLIDIDDKKSDMFYKKYVATITDIAKEIPFESENIVEKYPY
jgi:hypothetical protein